MAIITHDGQSFLIDGKRLWIVSGMVDYFRIPRSDWKHRIRLASEAGLNTILVRTPWALHESRRGDFNFDGDLDVQHFVSLIAGHGMNVILRPGPFIGSDLDLGGVPAWLLGEQNINLREGTGGFLEAASRFMGRLLDRLKNMQATNGGPICLVQCEHEWYCGNPEAAEAYLLEIARFIREHNFDVPLINTNNLWQRREETIDTWSGRDQMLSHLRQLRTIHPNYPLLVGDFTIGEYDRWGRKRPEALDGPALMHRLGQVLAAGSQFNLTPFAGGTNFGFSGGRVVGTLDEYHTASAENHAPVSEAGRRGGTFPHVRRLCTFASQFGKVFASLEPRNGPAILAVEGLEKGQWESTSGFSVVQLSGSQGSVVFVFGEEGKTKEHATIILSNGQSVPVHLGDQTLSWCIMDVHIGGRARLDWTNLNALATNHNNILVLFGASGQPGLVSINYSLLEFKVPDSHVPHVEVHEDITLVICNESTVDATFLKNDVVHVGILGFDGDGNPIPHPEFKHRLEVTPGGKVAKRSISIEPHKRSSASLGEWAGAALTEYLDGSAPRFAAIDGALPMERCANGYGYGFVRIALPKSSARKANLLCPGAGDRVHVFVKGQREAIVGSGPGASGGAFAAHVPGSKSENPGHIVVLVDNLGRFAGGNEMNEGKGLFHQVHEVTAVRLGKPSIEDGPTVNPFTLKRYFEGLHGGEMTAGRDLMWTFEYRKKTPVIVEVKGAAAPALVRVNGTTVGLYTGATGRPLLHAVVNPEILKRGKNEVRIAPIGGAQHAQFEKAVALYESEEVITEGAAWSYAKWEQPKAGAFKPVDRALLRETADRPAWFKTTLTVRDHAAALGTSTEEPEGLWFEPVGMSKGQVFLNGMNVGRYWVADPAGKSVGPQKRYLLPKAWLRPAGETNDLVIFDEHGCDPSKARVVFATDAW